MLIGPTSRPRLTCAHFYPPSLKRNPKLFGILRWRHRILYIATIKFLPIFPAVYIDIYIYIFRANLLPRHSNVLKRGHKFNLGGSDTRLKYINRSSSPVLNNSRCIFENLFNRESYDVKRTTNFYLVIITRFTFEHTFPA